MSPSTDLSTLTMSKALFALVWLLVLASCRMPSPALAARPLLLEYYMHDDGLGVNVVMEIPAHDSNVTEGFGSVVAMDLPLTLTPDPTSTRLGAERCLAASLSLYYNPSYLTSMHMCTVTYSDSVYHGVFSTMGEYNLMKRDAFEYGVTGGSIDFRGAQGYVIATLHSNVSSHIIYHFTAHLTLPDPPIMSHRIVSSQLKYNINDV